MQLTLEVPEATGKAIQSSSVLRERASEALVRLAQEALGQQVQSMSTQVDLILQDLATDPMLNLDGYSTQLVQDMREFRENVAFQNDK